ncbi:MAG: GntR family transcriptional regulator [Lachnospiraceae bacterium]|nr:GntR family transcriptional regulator [Lachnospiraceae bacterium]
MYIEIDFESDEAIYVQLRNQIVMGIATNQYQVGESLPSVRQLAESIGINMHTVNKAYHVLRQEGFIRLDRRNGAVIFLEEDKSRAVREMQETLQIILAKAVCKNVSRGEVHELVDEIYDRLTGGTNA